MPVKNPGTPKKVRKPKIANGWSASAESACQEYVLNGADQSKAYRKGFQQCARWKDKTVHEHASRFFKEGKVQARIKELQEAAAKLAQEKFSVDAEYVLGRLVEIDQMDLLDILNDDGSLKFVTEWPKIWRNFISGIDLAELFEGRGDDRKMIGVMKKIKWPDKVKNLELLGKHVSVNAFREQVGISDPHGNPVRATWELQPVAASGNPG